MTPVTADQLLVLATVVEEGSFSAAARKLGRTQGAVSYNVATLERLLEVALFERDGRRPTLTGAGDVILRRARAVLDRMAELQVTARQLNEGLEPSLVIAVDTLFPASVLADVLRAFRARYPTVLIDVRIGVLSDVPQLVLRGACDVGVTGAVVDTSKVASMPCRTVELVPVCSSQHPLASLDGEASDATLRMHTNLVLAEIENGGTSPSGLSAGTSWRISDSHSRLELVRAGLGWARLPREQIQRDLHDGRLVQFRARRWRSATNIELNAIHLNHRAPGPAGSWLLERLSAT